MSSRNRMRSLSAGLVVLATLTTGLVSASAQDAATQVVAPAGVETVDGNSFNRFPFGLVGGSMRYQQAHAAALFPGSGTITELRFRPDVDAGGAFGPVELDVEIRLSTTASPPDTMSRVFADNVGPDETVVLARGPLTLASAASGDAVNAFDVVVPLTTPFEYDPAMGNLLVDVFVHGGSFTTFLDAVESNTDGVGRRFAADVAATSDTNSAGTERTALVTQFVFGPGEPAVVDAEVDVRPDDEANAVPVRSNHRTGQKGALVKVAVLGSADLDASLVEPGSVTVGDPALDGRTAPVRSRLVDVDGDGDLDLVLRVRVGHLQDDGAIDRDSTQLSVTGTVDGVEFAGSDTVTVVGR